MREVIFRGQDVASNKWIYGDLRHKGDKLVIFHTDKNLGEEVKPNTVGQFTGFLDRSGKQIWEGDILRVWFDDKQFFVAVVVWHEGHAAFLLDEGDKCYSPMIGNCTEVVGNVHEQNKDDLRSINHGETMGIN